MGSMGKGDKATMPEIPGWLEDSLKPYLKDAVDKNQSMSDAAWEWGMANHPTQSVSAPYPINQEPINPPEGNKPGTNDPAI